MTDTNPIRINYTDARLRVLVEEYITQQRRAFTLQGVCSYVLYWAIEESKTSQFDNGLFVSDKVCQADSDCITGVLAKIICEGRIISNGDKFETLI